MNKIWVKENIDIKGVVRENYMENKGAAGYFRGQEKWTVFLGNYSEHCTGEQD